MAITDINFFTFWANNLPVRRRTARRIARGFVYMRPLQWLRDMFFNEYVNRNQAGFYWGSIYPYFPGDIEVYRGDYKTYQVKENMTPPIGTLPTNTTYWYKVADYPVGFFYRQHATAEKLKLEWLLNKWFSAVYANPPLTSDIYITTLSPDNEYFLAGYNEQQSSLAVFATGTAANFVGASNPNYDAANFEIHIPIAKYNAIASTNLQREKIFRRVVDERIIAGTQYTIITY